MSISYTSTSSSNVPTEPETTVTNVESSGMLSNAHGTLNELKKGLFYGQQNYNQI